MNEYANEEKYTTNKDNVSLKKLWIIKLVIKVVEYHITDVLFITTKTYLLFTAYLQFLWFTQLNDGI